MLKSTAEVLIFYSDRLKSIPYQFQLIWHICSAIRCSKHTSHPVLRWDWFSASPNTGKHHGVRLHSPSSWEKRVWHFCPCFSPSFGKTHGVSQGFPRDPQKRPLAVKLPWVPPQWASTRTRASAPAAPGCHRARHPGRRSRSRLTRGILTRRIKIESGSIRYSIT